MFVKVVMLDVLPSKVLIESKVSVVGAILLESSVELRLRLLTSLTRVLSATLNWMKDLMLEMFLN